VDWKIREGFLSRAFPHHFPLVLGWEFAGEVAAVGYAARRFDVGDKARAMQNPSRVIANWRLT
jgi:NADPH:quinone reductase-like Zn-dependent oxidoreductase